MPKQKMHHHSTTGKTVRVPAMPPVQHGSEQQDPKDTLPFTAAESGSAMEVVNARGESDATRQELMTMREAADFLMEDEDAVADILTAADVPLVHKDGQTYVACDEVRRYRDRDTAERRAHLRELTRLSIDAGLDDVDYSRLSDHR